MIVFVILSFIYLLYIINTIIIFQNGNDALIVNTTASATTPYINPSIWPSCWMTEQTIIMKLKV